MEVRLLAKGYDTDEMFYQDFLDDKVNMKDEYFSGEEVYIREAPDFPIYMGRGGEEEKKQNFLHAFRIISQSYLETERNLLLDETFWHSLLVTHKRDFIIDNYPEVQDGINKFRNIVLKKFDWENYIYKSILGTQYTNDNIKIEEERQRFYKLIIENLDLYNYIIKSEIFRNDKFLMNVLEIIDDLNLSKVLKAKIKGRGDLGDDERYGRRVIFEFNKSYPVIMSPVLEKGELKKLFIRYLSYYYDIYKEILEEDYPANDPEIENHGQMVDYTETTNLHSSYQKDSFFASSDFSDKRVEFDSSPKINIGVLESDSSIQVKEIIEKKDKIESTESDELLTYLASHDLEFIDHRNKGGSLWVIGDRRIEAYLKSLEEEGIYFRFKPVGGKASKHKPAWFWVGEKR